MYLIFLDSHVPYWLMEKLEIEKIATLNQEVNHVQSSVPPVVIPTLQCNTNAVKQQQRTIGPK